MRDYQSDPTHTQDHLSGNQCVNNPYIEGGTPKIAKGRLCESHLQPKDIFFFSRGVMFEMVFDYAHTGEEDISVGGSYPHQRKVAEVTIASTDASKPFLAMKFDKEQFELFKECIADMELPE